MPAARPSSGAERAADARSRAASAPRLARDVLVELGRAERLREKSGDLQRRQDVLRQPAQRGELPDEQDRDQQAGFGDGHSRRIISADRRSKWATLGSSGFHRASGAPTIRATTSIAFRNALAGGCACPSAQASISATEAPSACDSRSAPPSVSIARRNVLVYALSLDMRRCCLSPPASLFASNIAVGKNPTLRARFLLPSGEPVCASTRPS